jgi:hypothetical protein
MTTNSVIMGLSNLILPDKNAQRLEVTNEEKIVICLYKSLDEDELELLKRYGKVLYFNSSYLNLSLDRFNFDYFILDLREEDHRIYFQKYTSHTKRLLFRHSYETNNGVSFHNELSSLPKEQALKTDFDFLLFSQPIPSPKCFISLFRSCIFGKAQVNV